jgi:pimeloyl-ACP methyl ester carboxylesterase
VPVAQGSAATGHEKQMDKENTNRSDLGLVDRGEGPVVVLLHGFPLDGSMWAAQIEGLSTHYRVIVPDLRGFGQCPPSEDVTTMEQMADDVADALDALAVDEPLTLAGLSMGGYVALAFWRKYAARLRALVLCDTRAAADTPEAIRTRHETARRVLAEGTSVLAETMAPRLFSPVTTRDRPHVVDAVRQMILRADPRAAAAALRGMAVRTDSTPLLGQIDCPVLALVGSDDAITPAAEMRDMTRAIPHAQFVEIPQAGHLAPMEQPAEVNAALTAFLGES